MLLASLFYKQNYMSLQLFIFLNLIYTAFCVKYKLNMFRNQRIQIVASEVSTHFIVLFLFLFTDFVALTETQLIYSYVYVICFGLVSLLNVVMIVYNVVLNFQRKRMLNAIKKAKEA